MLFLAQGELVYKWTVSSVTRNNNAEHKSRTLEIFSHSGTVLKLGIVKKKNYFHVSMYLYGVFFIYIYMCVRRSRQLVGKPIATGANFSESCVGRKSSLPYKLHKINEYWVVECFFFFYVHTLENFESEISKREYISQSIASRALINYD